MFLEELVGRRERNIFSMAAYTISTMKLPQSDHSVNPLSTPLPMKDEGAVGSGQIRFINENVLSCPGLHGFYKK